MKKSKNKKKISNEPIAKKSKTILKRKQLRKDKRQAKKSAKKEFVSKKFRKTNLKDHEDEEIPSDQEEQSQSLGPGVVGKSKQDHQKPAQNENDKMKKQMKELKRQQKKQRKRQLILANEAEQLNIKQLEKNLGLKKRKSKNMPKSFTEDGLDFLLDACDSSKLANWNDDDDLEEKEDFMGEGSRTTMDESDLDEGSDLDDIFSDNNEEDESEPDQSDVCLSDEEDTSKPQNEELDSDDEDEKEEEFKEDIYGRKRDARGNIVKDCSDNIGPSTAPECMTVGRYIPPAMRKKANLGVTEEKKKALERLSKQLKGLLNRLAESNMIGISREIEKFYNSNSRNDVNRSLAELLESCLVHKTAIIPCRLIMEHCMLVAILTANVGTEVGAFMLQHMVGKFNEQFNKFNERDEDSEERDVAIDNLLVIICYLYSWHIVQSSLMFDVLHLLLERFSAKDVQLIVTALTNCGMMLRKDDPAALRNFILNVQSKASKADIEDSRVLFMIEVLNGIKNNNVNKIPNYDPSHFEHLKKSLKSSLREGKFVTELNISYKDLIQADTKGRWWIVGSAFTGNLLGAETEMEDKSGPRQEEFSTKLLELARKMRMNTDTRRRIFCLLMSSEDYLDCSEKLVKLGTKNQTEREVVFVVTDCCLQETDFNPYYGHVASKLASLDRKYRLAMTFCIWDRIKQLKTMKNFQRANLASLSQFLILERAQSISLLKVIEFADMDKPNMRFLVSVLTGILETETEKLKEIFKAVSEDPKLKIFRDSLQLFMNHFLLKQTKNTDTTVIKAKVRIAEKSLTASVSSLRL